MGVQRKVGGSILLTLNISERPIANKYCEGKMKRTLKRELNRPETVEEEAVKIYYSAVSLGCGLSMLRNATVKSAEVVMWKLLCGLG